MKERIVKFLGQHKIDIVYYTIFAIFIIYAYIIFPPNIWEKMTDFEKGAGTAVWLLIAGNFIFVISAILLSVTSKSIWHIFAKNETVPDGIKILSLLFNSSIFVLVFIVYFLFFIPTQKPWLAYNPFTILPAIITILYYLKGEFRRWGILLLLVIPILLITYNNFYNTINMP